MIMMKMTMMLMVMMMMKMTTMLMVVMMMTMQMMMMTRINVLRRILACETETMCHGYNEESTSRAIAPSSGTTGGMEKLNHNPVHFLGD